MNIGYKMQKRIIIALFLFLPIVFLFMFFIYPVLDLIRLSFTTNASGLKFSVNYFNFEYMQLGLKNYKMAFDSSEIWIALKNNLYYFAGAIFQNMLALFLAVIILSGIRCANMFKTCIFIPYIINAAAIAFMFKFMYQPLQINGVINTFLHSLGLKTIPFLSGEGIVNSSMVFVSIWRYLGFSIVIYITAIQSVQRELYESSRVDGANAWQDFWYITFPGIKRIIELSMIIGLAGALNAFTEAHIITSGGPGYESTTFLLYALNVAFQFNQYGLASALSVLLALIIIFITIIQRKVFADRGLTK